MLLLGIALTSPAQALVFLSQATPTMLSASITPEAGETGVKNVYIGVLYQGNMYLRGTATGDWRAYTSGTFPVAGQINLSSGTTTVTIADFDISSLVGLDVYVGYGVNDADISTRGHLAKVYTVPTPVATTCTPTTLTTGVTTCMYPNNVKVAGVNELIGSFLIGDAAWTNAMNSGLIKTVDTGEILTGFSTRPIIRAVLMLTRSDGGKAYCVTPIYKDDGKAIGSYTNPGSACFTESFDWIVGGSDGVTLYFPGRNQCYKDYWKESASTLGAFTFGSKLVPCP